MKDKVMRGLGSVRGLLADVKAEFRRTTWPDRRELKQSTLVVMFFIVLLAASVLVCDKVIQFLLSQIHA